MSIDLDEPTARKLLQAASSQGMDVSEFVRVCLLNQIPRPETSSIVGAMADQAELLDSVCEDAMTARQFGYLLSPCLVMTCEQFFQ